MWLCVCVCVRHSVTQEVHTVLRAEVPLSSPGPTDPRQGHPEPLPLTQGGDEWAGPS